MNTVRIFDIATGALVHEMPLDLLFELRPEREDHIKIVAPMFVLLKRQYRIEYGSGTPAGGGDVTPAVRA